MVRFQGLGALLRAGVFALISLAVANQSQATIINFSDPSGLAAQVEFTLVNPTTLEVRARNTSTGVPLGFSNSDQILTGVSWDFDPLGPTAATTITGGSVKIGPTSSSQNFSTGSYGANFDVSGEYGFGNGGGTGIQPNFVSGNQAGSTPFGGPDLDGPPNLDGPQAGLVADPILVPLGGLGAIKNEFIATLTLSSPLADLSFIRHSVTVEFGSDAAFLHAPEPGSLLLVGVAAALLLPIGVRRCRRQKTHKSAES